MHKEKSLSESRAIVAISGALGSGKSRIARDLSQMLNWQVVSFGSYIRAISVKRGIIPKGSNLQNLGEELVTAGPEKFCQDVLDYHKWSAEMPVVVEGIRHLEILNSLREIVVPLPVIWLFIDVPYSIREQRIRNREEIDSLRPDTLVHSTEVQIPGMAEAADFRIDGAEDEEIILNKALSYIRLGLSGL